MEGLGAHGIPFMLNLAITGSLYLFKDEINNTFFASRYIVADSPTTLKPSAIAALAAAAVPGSTVSSYKDPHDGNRSAIVTVASGNNSILVFVNPHDGRVLDKVASNDEFTWVLKKIHSLN
jgi:uncharacterized iron-regulated membrane protein